MSSDGIFLTIMAFICIWGGIHFAVTKPAHVGWWVYCAGMAVVVAEWCVAFYVLEVRR